MNSVEQLAIDTFAECGIDINAHGAYELMAQHLGKPINKLTENERLKGIIRVGMAMATVDVALAEAVEKTLDEGLDDGSD